MATAAVLCFSQDQRHLVIDSLREGHDDHNIHNARYGQSEWKGRSLRIRNAQAPPNAGFSHPRSDAQDITPSNDFVPSAHVARVGY